MVYQHLVEHKRIDGVFYFAPSTYLLEKARRILEFGILFLWQADSQSMGPEAFVRVGLA